jgi:uncharacterized protein
MWSGPFRLPDVSSSRRAVVLGLGLALYGNVIAVVAYLMQAPPLGPLCETVMGVLVLATTARTPAGWARLGLTTNGLGSSLLAGLALGSLPAIVLVIRLLLPVSLASMLFSGRAGPTVPTYLQLIVLLLGVALPEELAFRGLLQTQLRAAFPPGKAIVIGGFCFASWHMVVNLVTLGELGLSTNDILSVGFYLGQFMLLVLTGLAFAFLRERSGNLTGCVAAHWLADALLMSTFGWPAAFSPAA